MLPPAKNIEYFLWFLLCSIEKSSVSATCLIYTGNPGFQGYAFYIGEEIIDGKTIGSTRESEDFFIYDMRRNPSGSLLQKYFV